MSAADRAAPLDDVARSNRRCLLALPFALALAAWLALADSWQAYRALDAPNVIEVAPGASGGYGGSEWRLLAVEQVAAGRRRGLPAGVARVRVEIAVIPRDVAAVAALAVCAVELVAGDGRRWSATGGDLFAADALPERCDGDYKHKPALGEAMRFEQFFTLPETAAAQVSPVIVLGRRDSARLRLRRH